MNTLTNRIAWKQHFVPPAPSPPANVLSSAVCSGGSLSTAGNLVFVGAPAALDHAVVAYNATTGQELARFKTDATVNSPSATALVNGKQYLFVYANGRVNTSNPAVNGDNLYAYNLG